jgi:hypothetical protein
MTLIIMENKCAWKAGLINYYFIVVFLLGLFDLLTFFSNRGSPLLNVIIQFLYSSLLPVINEPKIHLFPVIYYKSEYTRYRV